MEVVYLHRFRILGNFMTTNVISLLFQEALYQERFNIYFGFYRLFRMVGVLRTVLQLAQS